VTTATTGRLYGVRDIAEAIGKPRGLVAQWHKRGRLPPADQYPSGAPVWYAATIEPWIAKQKED
jgi:hypothetical protein